MRNATRVFAIVVLGAFRADALELLVNGDFDDPPSVGWTCSPPLACTPSVLDVDDSATSGSAFLATEAAAGSTVTLSQCIPVAASTSYDFAGWALVSSSNTATTILRIRMAWHDDAACSSLLFSEVLASAAEVGVWTPLARTRPSPPEAMSGRFDVQFLKSPSAAGVVSARVDALSVPEPTAAWCACAAFVACILLGFVRRGSIRGLRAPRRGPVTGSDANVGVRRRLVPIGISVRADRPQPMGESHESTWVHSGRGRDRAAPRWARRNARLRRREEAAHRHHLGR